MALFFSDGPLGDSVRPKPRGIDGSRYGQTGGYAAMMGPLIPHEGPGFARSRDRTMRSGSMEHDLQIKSSREEEGDLETSAVDMAKMSTTAPDHDNASETRLSKMKENEVKANANALAIRDVAGSAIGIASLGIQICRGLLSYYDGWKSSTSDIGSAYASIADLSKTLTLLVASLEREQLDEERTEQVKSCLQSCESGLSQLSKKLQKLQKYGELKLLQQKTQSQLQRAWYPFRASTLVKLREIAENVQERLKLALQVLQLDVSTTLRRTLVQVAADTRDTGVRTANIEAQNVLLLAAQQSDQFRKMTDWLSPPDPWSNHASARFRHEPQTGAWVLQSEQYREWKDASINHLWLYGKAGCGKTILCSTVIEDVRAHCETTANSAHAAFYFSFSDNQKQSYESLLRSLVAQLGWKEPGLSMLRHAYESPSRSLPGPDDQETILLSSIKSYNKVFLVLDALDECPEGGEVRQNVLERLEGLSQRAPNLRIFVTSRELRDVRESMEMLGADAVAIDARSVDADIRKYVSTELLRNRKLCRLDSETKTLIEEAISQKADGMFRWAYCQLQELKKLKSTKPKYVKEALRHLPATLDATYERMLTGIEEMFRMEALTLLRWLAYAKSPLSLGELAEATVINPAVNGVVDVDNRGSLEDTLDILSGLVTAVRLDSDDADEGVAPRLEIPDSEDIDTGFAHPGQQFKKGTKVRLAHFSVKEYLESTRILQSHAKDFYLESAKEHRFLAQSCLMYILYYSSSSEKTSTNQDLVTFPLLRYTAQSWFSHSSQQQQRGGFSQETSLLSSENIKKDWLHVYQPDRTWSIPFKQVMNIGSSLYYASVVGLEAVVQILMDRGMDVNAQGGAYGNALQAASYEGYETVVQMLIRQGADVNACGGRYGNALQAASVGGHDHVVQILIELGADVNAHGGLYGNALQAASVGGYDKVVQILIELGADVNAHRGLYGNALQAASSRGHEKAVQILVGNALQAASVGGHDKVVEMLIERGADVNAQRGEYGYALQAASIRGHDKVVEMLIERGADVNAQGGKYGNALQAALIRGHEKVVAILIERGADVKA